MSAVDSLLSPALARVFHRVAAERRRQEQRWGRGEVPVGGIGFGPEASTRLRAVLGQIALHPHGASDAERATKAACDGAAAAGTVTGEHVLLEELAEVYAAACVEQDPARISAELEQLVAVGCKLLEALDPARDRLEGRSLRVYVAAPMGEAHVAVLLGRLLASEGFDVVSRWTGRLAAQSEHPTDDALDAIQRGNQAELGRADLVVAWTAAGHPRATYCEIAWALAHGTRVLWIQGPSGEGSNLFDRERLVTVLRFGADWTPTMRDRRVLDAAFALEATIRETAAGVQPLPSRGEAIPASLLHALHEAIASGQERPFADLCAAALRLPAHADMHEGHVLAGLHHLVQLGVLDATDPGPGGSSRWRHRSDMVADLQRELATVRRSSTMLAAEVEAMRDALAAKGSVLVDGQPIGIATREIAAGEIVIAGSMVTVHPALAAKGGA